MEFVVFVVEFAVFKVVEFVVVELVVVECGGGGGGGGVVSSESTKGISTSS